MSSLEAGVRGVAGRAQVLRLAVAAAALAVGSMGCGQGEAPDVTSGVGTPPVDTAPLGTGSIEFSLTAPGGVNFSSFDYVITGPNVARSGSIDVSHSTTVSAVIDRLPIGSGYSLTVMGSTTSPVANCSGSAPFSIGAGVVTRVPVSIACHVKQDVVPPPAVPVPPFAPVALAAALLALGTVVVGHRRAGGGRPS